MSLDNLKISVIQKGGAVMARVFGIDRAMDHFMGKQVLDLNFGLNDFAHFISFYQRKI